MLRFFAPILFLAIVCSSCVRERVPAGRDGFVILAPDWRNHVVHRITMDGAYEGDFLDRARFGDAKIERRLWESPRGLLYLDGHPDRFWLLGERTLSQWGGRGQYQRTIYSDSAHLEEPAAIGRIGDRVFVLSEDKKCMLVFNLEGELLATFGAPVLDRAKDFVVGPDGLIYVGGSLLHAEIEGLVTVWDPARTEPDAKPVRYLVPPELGEDGTFWIHSLVFDDNGDLLVTEFSRGRLERWDPERNAKIGVLLDSDASGKYTELARGPDGLVYMAGPDGLYRFDSLATAESLKQLTPFFDARSIADRYERAFAPAWLAFVPRSALDSPHAP
jgi:hypothetical protein